MGCFNFKHAVTFYTHHYGLGCILHLLHSSLSAGEATIENGWMGGCTYVWMDGWVDVGMYGWMDGWMFFFATLVD